MTLCDRRRTAPNVETTTERPAGQWRGRHPPGERTHERIRSRLRRTTQLVATLALASATLPAFAQAQAQAVNAYSIWPENWARPMFEEFEKATRIKVNFVRFSSAEAPASSTWCRTSGC